MSRWWVRVAAILSGLFVLALAIVTVLGHQLPQINPVTAGLISIAFLIIFLFGGFPVAVAMGLVGFLGMVYLEGLGAGLATLGSAPYRTVSSHVFIAIPLFLLMGEFTFHSKLGEDLFAAAHKWFGRLPGGLAMATVGASAAFGTICGESLATAATMGTVALPEMKKYKYDDGLATGAVAAGGCLGGFIAPSVTIIIYCLLTRLSVATQFIASFVPGFLTAALFMITIYIICRLNPLAGPRGPSASFIEKLRALMGAWGMVVLFLLIIGGLYTGVFTPTEAGGVGAFGALLLALSKRRLTRQNLMESLLATGRVTAMIFIILVGAKIFSYFLVVSGLPTALASLATGLEVSRYVIWAGIVLIYLFLGCIFDPLALLIITIPITFPIMMDLGFDPIWFGAAILVNDEMALITPPLGMNVFVIKGVAGDVPMYTIFRGVIPYIIVLAVFLILITAFPQIVLFVPNVLGLT